MNRNLPGHYWLAAALLIIFLLAPLAAAINSKPGSCRQLISDSRSETQTVSAGYAYVSACLPWRPNLWEEAAHEALQAKQVKAAISYLEAARQKSIQRGKTELEALSLQGFQDLEKAYEMQGDYQAALRAFQIIANRLGLNEKQTQEMSRLYLVQEDFAGAITIWQQLSEKQPDNAEALYQTGLLLATQDPESALPALEKAALRKPVLEKEVSSLRQAIMGARLVDDPAYSLLQVGRVLAGEGRWDLAAEAFHQAVLRQPGYAEGWAFLGEARQHLPVTNRDASNPGISGDPGLNELQTAIELDPQSLSANTFLALYWMRCNEYEKALTAIKQAIALSPENPALIAELAGIQAVSGDLYGAYENYQKAASLSPYEPGYKRRIIRFSLEYNFNVKEVALPIARLLLAGDDQDPVDLDLMAQVLILQGDLSNAERFLTRAISADQRSAAAHLHLGLVYLLQGKKNLAANELQLAISLDPGGPIDQQAQRLLGGSNP